MKKQKFRLVRSNCESCGKEVLTGNRSLHGLDQLKAQFGVRCEGCTTPAEENALLKEMGAQIAGRAS